MTVGSWSGRARLAAVLAVAVLGVAGCSAQNGAAAVVEGEAISLAEVHEATRQLAPYLRDASPSAVLLLLMAEPTFERIAQEHGVGVSDSEAQAVLDRLAESTEGDATADGAPPEFGEAALTVARFTLLQQKLQELPDAATVLEEATAELAELDIEVNPRYGEVDFADGRGITPVEHPWLVTPDAG